MDIKRLPQQSAAHRRALNVPAWPAFAPGTVPRRLARFGRFPERKVARRTLLARRLAAFALLAVGRAVAELAVIRRAIHVEEHVAIGFVGKALFD